MNFTFNLLLQKWSESLSFLKGRDALISLFSILQTFKRAIKILWVHLILLMSGSALIYFVLPQINSNPVNPITLIAYLIFAVYGIWFVFRSILCVRPSLEIKDKEYFVRYRNKFWGTIALIGFYAIIAVHLAFISPRIVSWTSPFVGPIVTFGVFFWIDAASGAKSFFKSIFNGAKLTLYFAPVIVPFFVLSSFLNLYFASSKIMQVISMPMSLFTLSVVVVLYTKIKHSNYKLFF